MRKEIADMDIKKLLSQMTVDEKIGQLAQYNANVFLSSDADITGPKTKLGLKDEDVCKVGSVLNFKSPEETIKIQKEHLEKDRNGIPIIFMMDVIHGYRTIFPIPLALGCSFDTELVKECTRMASKEASAGGIHATFTPMVDYVRDARWGRVMETCGEEPMLNGMMGAAQVEAFKEKGLSHRDSLATCVKHFAAYGGAEAGRDYAAVELSEHALYEFYLPAYKACIDAGVDMLMPSFNTLNGVPATANSWLMKKVLKDEWGFEGIVISDYNAVGELIKHGVAKDKKEAARLAFDNGCDIEMCSSSYYHHLQELIDEGVFTMEALDAAVLRVLNLKNELGLFEDPYRDASTERESEVCLTPEHRAIAKKAAENCAVLLKNDGVLPFSKSVKSIALIGPFADEKKIIGFWACRGEPEKSVTVKEGIERLLPNADVTVVSGCGAEWNDLDKTGFENAIAAAKAADAVVLCLGEPQDYSGEGNCRTDLTLPGVQAELARAVCEVNKNTAALIFNGRPLVLSNVANEIPAILDMWFPGTEGGSAAAALLFGDANPSGKLTMSFPKATGQCPLYYNHTATGRPRTVAKENERIKYHSAYLDCGNLPLYPFGHGLSYSNFVYEDMALDCESMTKDGEITITINIHNDSDVDGFETVQLYMRDLVASNARPVAQLIAFEKVFFKAGDKKSVTFKVKEPMLRFWNNQNEFVSEPGEFNLMTGNADNFKFTKKIVLE